MDIDWFYIASLIFFLIQKKRRDGLFTALLKTQTLSTDLPPTKRKLTSFPDSHRETLQNVTQKLEFTQGRGLGSTLLWIKNRKEWKYLAITIHKQFTSMLNGKKKKKSPDNTIHKEDTKNELSAIT